MTELENYLKFREKATNGRNPEWQKKTAIARLYGNSYASCMVASCAHKEWWYNGFEGTEFFCLLKPNFRGKNIEEVWFVEVRNSKIALLRSLPAYDIVLL